MHLFDSYKEFHSVAQHILQKLIQEADEYLKPFELTLYIDEDYDFDDEYYEDCIAVYENSTVFSYEIQIALNLPHLFDLYNTPEADEFDWDLKNDLTVSVYHEIGHALIEYFCDEELFPDNGAISISPVITDDKYDEEEIVEEFGRSFAPVYTHVNHNESVLWKALQDIKEQLKHQNQTN